MPVFFGQKQSIVLQTRKGNPIKNDFDASSPIPGVLKEAADYKGKYLAATHRPTLPTSIYNCHGLTFASRRTCVYDDEDLRKIISEDEYKVIKYPSEKLFAGDIVLYVTGGAIVHSGIVVELLDFAPKVLSKWGGCHEVIHALADCPYSASGYEFWRIVS